MSKMSELSLSLDELTACGKELITVGEKLVKAAEAIRGYFSTEPEAHTAPEVEEPPQEITPAAEPEKPKYTFADVRKAAAGKANEGYATQVMALAGKYHANKLIEVEEKDYPAFMAELEAIG